MRTRSLTLCTAVLLVLLACGCGSAGPATSAAVASPSTHTAPPATPVSSLEALQRLSTSRLRTAQFVTGSATTACNQPDRPTCVAYEQAGDTAIAAYLAAEKSIAMTPSVAAVDQFLHQHLAQWLTIADTMIANFADPVQRNNTSYLLDAANASIQQDIDDLANLPG